MGFVCVWQNVEIEMSGNDWGKRNKESQNDQNGWIAQHRSRTVLQTMLIIAPVHTLNFKWYEDDENNNTNE